METRGSEEEEKLMGRKVVGKAFMQAMGDALGQQEVFKTLQQDNYWYVACSALG
jgi:hypothetical protein